MLEFVMVAPILVALVMTLVDLGWWFQDQVAVDTIVRSGARYASLNSNAWSPLAVAPANTIEGVIQAEGGPLTIANNDTAIAILYYDNSGVNPVLCGQYSQASAGWVVKNAYTQAGCRKAGALIEVDVTYTYQLQAPSPDLPITSTITKKCTVVEVV